MRISSISIAQPMNHNYRRNVKHVQAKQAEVQQPNFKGLKAGFCGLVGTIVGGTAATVLSGGALLPILLASSAGTYAGCVYGSIKEERDGKN